MEVAKITGDPNKLKEERTAIRDVLGKNQYDLISGKVCFDKNGDAQLLGYILTMKNKQWKLLETHAPLPLQLSLSLKQTLKRGRLGLPLFLFPLYSPPDNREDLKKCFINQAKQTMDFPMILLSHVSFLDRSGDIKFGA